MSTKVTETKRHLNKPTEQYECDLIESSPGHMTLRYVSDRTFASTRLGITFPPGCITVALYWEDRPYVFWGIFSPDKELLGYLIHICRDVKISEDAVGYLDMLLDIWFFPDGRHLILDEDEVEECLQAGALSPADKDYIERSEKAAIAAFQKNAEILISIAGKLDIFAQPQ
jgi:hypothetical protein